jgi:hypothetical protein
MCSCGFSVRTFLLTVFGCFVLCVVAVVVGGNFMQDGAVV